MDPVRSTIFSLLLVFVFAMSAFGGISTAERNALIDLYNSTNPPCTFSPCPPPAWTIRTNWLGAVGTECTWFGVTCATVPGAMSRVEKLDLHDNALTGAIPASISGLDNLKTLNLSDNRINGSIPSSVGSLSKLQILNLGDNQLSGAIPSTIGNLADLRSLTLSTNTLTGTLPSTLGNLTKLQDLFLDTNEFAGEIPTWIGNFPALLHLSLHKNHFSGEVPASLCNLTSLTYLRLDSNSLGDSFPPLIGNLIHLQYLYVQSNKFRGPVPHSIRNLTGIGAGCLDISYNSLWIDDTVGMADYLNQRQPGWKSTQTLAPEPITVNSLTQTSAHVTWTPIPFSSYGGHYEVVTWTDAAGLVSTTSTSSKTDSHATVTGLTPGTTYNFQVNTTSDPNPFNSNTLKSYSSNPVSATTLAPATPPSVSVNSNPPAMFEGTHNPGKPVSFVVLNTGGTATTVALERRAAFFSISPAQLVLAPGAGAEVTVTPLLMPPGTYSSSIGLSGSGVPSGLSVPVHLLVLSAAPGSDIVATSPRIDVAGPVQTIPGSVNFLSRGASIVTGVLVSEAPWLTPAMETPITIEPGKNATLGFTINRDFARDPSSPSSLVTTLRFAYPPQAIPAGRSHVEAGDESFTQPGCVVAATPALPTTSASIPSLNAGERGIIIPWMRSMSSTPVRLLTDVVVGATGPDPDADVYLLPAGQTGTHALKSTNRTSIAKTAPLYLADVIARGFSRPESSGSLHLRSGSSSGVVAEASTLAIEDSSGKVSFRETPTARSDRGAGAGTSLILPGVAFFRAGPSSIRIQETEGGVGSFAIDFLDSSGGILHSIPPQTIESFQLLDVPLPNLSGIATIVVRNTGSTGRLFAASEESSSSIDAASVWDSTSVYGGIRSETVMVPSVRAIRRRLRPVRKTPEVTGESDDKTVLSLYSANGARVQIELRREAASEKVTVDLGARQTRLWTDLYQELFGTKSGGNGALVIQPLSGEVAAAAWTTAGDGSARIVTTMPVVPAARAIGSGSEWNFFRVSDASKASLNSKVAAAMNSSLGLIETNGSDASVEVVVRFESSRTLPQSSAAKTYSLHANQLLVVDDIVCDVTGISRDNAGDIYDATVTVKVTSGSVLPYIATEIYGTHDRWIRTP